MNNSHGTGTGGLVAPEIEGFRQTEEMGPAAMISPSADALYLDLADMRRRLEVLETHFPEVTQLVASVSQIGQAVGMLQRQVVAMSQQRQVIDVQMERQVRSQALDLAIKAAPGGEGGALTALADAFVAWLKAGPPHPEQGQVQ